MASGGSRNGSGRKPLWDRPCIRVHIPRLIGFSMERIIKDLDFIGIDDAEKIHILESAKLQKIRRYNSPVSAGEHTTSSIEGDSLHSDYEEINILDLLITKPGNMDLLTVTGESMIDIGIFPGDLLIVERAEIAKHNDVVIVSLNNEIMVKRFYLRDNKILLISENKEHIPIDISNKEYRISGIVRKSIRCNL